MYERILVPLDGSHVGEAALPHVEELVAKLSPQTKAEVTVLQVISSLTHYVIAGEASVQVPYSSKEIAQLKRKAKSYLDKVSDRLKKAGATVHTKVTTGNAAEEILRVAEESKADLIAMSTHGRHGLSRWAFGSVTDKILRGGVLPVLVVRAPKGTEND